MNVSKKDSCVKITQTFTGWPFLFPDAKEKRVLLEKMCHNDTDMLFRHRSGVVLVDGVGGIGEINFLLIMKTQ